MQNYRYLQFCNSARIILAGLAHIRISVLQIIAAHTGIFQESSEQIIWAEYCRLYRYILRVDYVVFSIIKAMYHAEYGIDD